VLMQAVFITCGRRSDLWPPSLKALDELSPKRTRQLALSFF
jgi:hypothetical protein